MDSFSGKSGQLHSPPSTQSSSSITAAAGPEAFANNSAYGKGFFEPDAYTVALKRCENGHDLAQQLVTMFEERAQLELSYTNHLRSWSRKWHGELIKSQDYGTNKKVWDQTITTGDQMADAHALLSSKLLESLIPDLRQWRKDNYERSLRHYKKTKEFEKEFMNVQKSWIKLLAKISECKWNYYAACKTAKLADNAERIASEEQRRKLADKAEIARRDVGFTKTKYEQAINESKEQRPHYEDSMKKIFERTQTFEQERLDRFKATFKTYSEILETATIKNSNLQQMNNDYKTSLANHDSEQDLIWWDQNYGTQTNSRWPEFEEYSD